MTDEGPLGRLVSKVEARVDDGEAISIGLIQEVAGQRAAGPMLLIPALIVISPLSIIPGIPTLVGVNTVLVAGQLVLGKDRIWLPKWLTARSVPAKWGGKLMTFLRPVSQVTDEVVRRRFKILTSGPVRRVGAAVCVFAGAIMPLLEFIPFTSTVAASIIAVFALAITARDGLLALVWLGLVGAAIAGALKLFF